MPVPDLIELVLLELMQHEGEVRDEIDAESASRPVTPTRRSSGRAPATVIPIGRARQARDRTGSAVGAPSTVDPGDLHRRCGQLRAEAERVRLASVSARERASAVLQAYRGDG
jgi:hypothetical protein